MANLQTGHWRKESSLVRTNFGPCSRPIESGQVKRAFGLSAIDNAKHHDSQFTSIDFKKTLKDKDIQICIDGKGVWQDNVSVERLRRSIKHEEMQEQPYDRVSASRESLRRQLAFYNLMRSHSSQDGQTLDQECLDPK